MKFYVDTFLKAINAQIERASASDRSNIIITIPSLDAVCLLRMANSAVDHCAREHASFSVTIKIARELVATWAEHQQAEATNKGWVAEGSLTEWRNKPQKSRESLLLLIGTDKIPDQGSLADFLSLSTDYLFKTTMNGSFRFWAKDLLRMAGIPSSKEAIRQLTEVLTCVNGLPGSGLLTISTWLETLPFHDCPTEKELAALLLSKLGQFKMPGFESYAATPGKKRKPLKDYFIPAADLFVFYDLGEAKRKQYITAIDTAREDILDGKEWLSESCIGNFNAEEDFLTALKYYVETGDSSSREQFLDCDFFPVFDKIFKLRKKREPKEHPRALKGFPVDVFLSAIWETLGDFHKSRDGEETPKQITISLKSWKYGSEGGEDDGFGGSKAEAVAIAEDRLHCMIGGIDELFAIRLSGENMPESIPDCVCSFDRSNLSCNLVRAIKSVLEFTVDIDGHSRKFVWKIGQQDDWELGIDLIMQCASNIPIGAWLPTYRLEFYDEMLSSTNESDTREILLHALNESGTADNEFCVNMLGKCGNNIADPLLTEQLPKLGKAYADFIRKCHDNGILHTIFDSEGMAWNNLCNRYQKSCAAASKAIDEKQSALYPLLMRAFLITPNEKCDFWEEQLDSGIVTLLHPALMQMLQARIVYLFSCFGAACAKAMKTQKWQTVAKVWAYYSSLAEIHSPIEVLKTSSGLTVASRGSGLIHKIGRNAKEGGKQLSTRLGMEPDENDKPGDSSLFAQNDESRMLFHILRNYSATHPEAWDGIRLAFFRSRDIQPVISAVNQYLVWLAEPKGRSEEEVARAESFRNRIDPYRLRLDFYTDVQDEGDVSRYVEKWDDVWQDKAMTRPESAYAHTVKTVTHTILPPVSDDVFTTRKLNSIDFNADIAFFFDIADYGKCSADFDKCQISDEIYDGTLQFPILEKKDCMQDLSPNVRYRVVNHRQFPLSAAFSKLVSTIQSHSSGEYILRAKVDFTDWFNLLNAAHDKSEWVACIDANIDKALIQKAKPGRDIISFGSGVGRSGEANYTISTEQTHIADLDTSLKEQIKTLYPSYGWNDDECRIMASNIRNSSINLTGLSLIRATSHRDGHIRDFIAHTQTYRFLKKPDNALCSALISLDDYPHWFNYSDDKMHPDLLWIIVLEDSCGKPILQARLIECKLANAGMAHLEKARMQIEAGFERLFPLFVPRRSKNDIADDSQPDRRYWWMQLHRIVSSAMQAIPTNLTDKYTILLENLAEGSFSIDWGCAVFAFWTNLSGNEEPACVSVWNLDDDANTKAMIWTFSPENFRKLALCDDNSCCMDWDTLLSRAVDQPGISYEIPYIEADGPGCSDLDEYESSEVEDFEDDDEDEGTGSLFVIPDIEEGSYTILPATVTVDMENRHTPSDSESTITTDVHCPIESTTAVDSGEKPKQQTNPAVITSTSDVDANETIAEISLPARDDQTSINLSDIRVFLGTDNLGKKYYWEFGNPGLNNRHLIVFGGSGCGKTYAMQCILCELAKAGLHNLVFDYTSSFTEYEIEKTGAQKYFPSQHYLKKYPLPVSPFRPQKFELGNELENEDPLDLATRVSAIFDAVYDLGIQQIALLEKALVEGCELYGEKFSFQNLYDIIDGKRADKGLPVDGLLGRINKILQQSPFSAEGDLDWSSIFKKSHENSVFQFQAIDKLSSRAIIEFFLWDLWGFNQISDMKKDAKIIVLDEIQNISIKDNSPVYKYLKEGRKFGFGIMAATQTLKGLGGSNSMENTELFQAGQKLFFRPSDPELKEFAKKLHDIIPQTSVAEWTTKLANLQKGECFFVGPILNETTTKLSPTVVRKIKIAALQERDL